MNSYLSEGELNAIKGLMHYLNTNMTPTDTVGVDVQFTDSNGESLGMVTWEPGVGQNGSFVLKFGS
jgi:hypothetical protein